MRIRQLYPALLAWALIGLLFWTRIGTAEEDRWTSRGHIGDSVWALDVNPQDPMSIYAGLWYFIGVFKVSIIGDKEADIDRPSRAGFNQVYGQVT